MFGSLPRLHRWVVVGVSVVAGAALGAWISSLAVARIPQSCADVLLGVCIGPQVNLLPTVAGAVLGLLVALLLVYDPTDRHRRR